jgi:hypothetical protein
MAPTATPQEAARREKASPGWMRCPAAAQIRGQANSPGDAAQADANRWAMDSFAPPVDPYAAYGGMLGR